MINKVEFDGEIGVFNEEDVEVLETFAKFVGEKLAQSGGRGLLHVGGKNSNLCGSVEAQCVRSSDAVIGGGSSSPTAAIQRPSLTMRRGSKTGQDCQIVEEGDEEED